MVAGIRSMQNERGELAHKMVGGSPDLYMRVMRDGDVFPVRRKFDSFHRFFEVVVVEDYASSDIDQ